MVGARDLFCFQILFILLILSKFLRFALERKLRDWTG